MSTELTPFQKNEFGALVELPDRVRNWKVETDNIKIGADKFVGELAAMQLPNMPAADLDALDSRLQSAIQRIAGAFTRIETDRKAATAILEEIKSYAMLPEKSIAGFPATLKAHRDAIAREKARRISESEADRKRELAKKNEAVELRVQLQKTIAGNTSAKISSTIQAVNAKFYSQTVATIDAYAEVLRKWDVSKVDLSDIGKNGELVAAYHTADEVAAIYADVMQGADLVQAYATPVAAERDRLLELIPSRRRELEEIAAGNAEAARVAQERQASEELERQTRQAQEAQERSQALETSAEIDKVHNGVDSESAAPVLQLARGTVCKKKYLPTTHKAWVAMLQSFVKHDLATMTLEEVQKKLGFVRTACEGRLNRGETIEAEGLKVEDDYSTRTRKTQPA